LVQSSHAIADFAYTFPTIFKDWKENSNSIISLAVKDLQSLEILCKTLDKKEIKYIKFYEPDINEYTAIAVEPSVISSKVTKYIPLACKKEGEINKHFLTKEKVIADMKATYQFKDQNVLQHGESVYKYFQKVMESIINGSSLYNDVIIPEHYFTHKDFIINNLYTEEQLKEYIIYHDLGKPYCKIIDDSGKQHFPNHAEKSYEIYKQIFNDDEVAELIKDDMDIHLLKDDGISEFIKKPTKQIITHLVVGLSELLSNAQMFGGLESDGFKIKYKNLFKRSKKILSLIDKQKQN
jgi:hypothetical protein